MTDKTKKTVECIVSVGVYTGVMVAGIVTALTCMKNDHIGHAVICFATVTVFNLVYWLRAW